VPRSYTCGSGVSIWGWSSGEQDYYDPVFGVIDVMAAVFLRVETGVVDVFRRRRDGKRVHGVAA
jgi:hypothetical protein